MYLTAERLVSGYDYNKDENFDKLLELMNLSKDDVGESASVSLEVGYWRKANAIHSWFVQNVQDGVDQCQRSYVTREQLEELRDECVAALAAYNAGEKIEAENVLAPTTGFFFGSTEIDDWYKKDLEKTIKIVEKCLSDKFKAYSFFYQASW